MFYGGGESKQRGAQHDGKTGPGIHPQDAGVGQRITGQGLHEGTGQPQRRTGQQASKGTGQAGIQHNSTVRALTGAGQGIDKHGDGQRFCANQQAECSGKN